MKNYSYQFKNVNILLLFCIMCFACLHSVQAQDLPEAAALPEGRDAWVINYFFHSNLIKGYAAAMPNDTRVIVQSDGVVFHRRTIQHRLFKNDSGWCQAQLSETEMKTIRAAMRKYRPNAWKNNYGPLPNALAPFGVMTITIPNAQDKAVGYTTKFLRFDTLPADLTNVLGLVADAGNLAFSKCGKDKPVENNPRRKAN